MLALPPLTYSIWRTLILKCQNFLGFSLHWRPYSHAREPLGISTRFALIAYTPKRLEMLLWSLPMPKLEETCFQPLTPQLILVTSVPQVWRLKSGTAHRHNFWCVDSRPLSISTKWIKQIRSGRFSTWLLPIGGRSWFPQPLVARRPETNHSQWRGWTDRRSNGQIYALDYWSAGQHFKIMLH